MATTGPGASSNLSRTQMPIAAPPHTRVRTNLAAHGEIKINAETSRVQVWVVPTNEELIVARQAAKLLEG